MILVDSSVWIDYFRGVELPHVAMLDAHIEQGDDLAINGIVLTEVLAGIRTDSSYRRVRSRLRVLELLPMSEAVFLRAAEIYRTLRARGVTIRAMADCLIAATAMEHDVAILHNDRDYSAIAAGFPLKIVSVEH